MKERSKSTFIIFLIALIIVLAIILSIKIIKTNIKNSYELTRGNGNNSKSIETSMNELKSMVKDKTDKIALIVNGQEISEREIAYVDFQINNKYANMNGKKKDATKEIIKQYIILSNAKELNMSLTDRENKQIETRIKESLKEGGEETNKMLDSFGMAYNEFMDFYIDRNKKSQLISKWNIYKIDAIDNGEIKIDNKSFNDKYEKYKSSKNVLKRKKLLEELSDIYIEYLTSNAIIEYIK